MNQQLTVAKRAKDWAVTLTVSPVSPVLYSYFYKLLTHLVKTEDLFRGWTTF